MDTVRVRTSFKATQIKVTNSIKFVKISAMESLKNSWKNV